MPLRNQADALSQPNKTESGMIAAELVSAAHSAAGGSLLDLPSVR